MPSPAQRPRAPLLWLLLPLIAGLSAAKAWRPPACGLWPLALAALVAGLIALACAVTAGRRGARGWGLSLGVAGALGGFVFLQLRVPQLHAAADPTPREVTVTIRVVQTFPAAPQSRSLGGIGVITATGTEDPALPGRRIYFSAIRRISVPPLRSGSYAVRGVLEPLPADPTGEGFSDYLANLGVRAVLGRARILREVTPPGWFPHWCDHARNRFEGILRHGLDAHPQPAALYVAMLLGGKAALSPDQQNAFTRSGTFHIFAISGLHIGVIAGALQATLRLLRVPRRPAVVLCLALLWLYAQITGGNTPALRAFLMIAFLLVAREFQLTRNTLAALVASALATLLLDPLQCFGSGFQMSYTVVTALVVFGVPLGERWLAAWRPFALLARTEWRWHHRAVAWGGRKLLGAGAAGWAAFLASTPSSIGFFQVFSPGSLAANLVIVPAAALAIVGGFLSLVAGLAGLLPLSAVANGAAASIIFAMNWVLEKATAWPGIYFPAEFKAGWMAPAALAVLTGLLLAGSAARWSRRTGGFWPPAILVALLLIFAVKYP